MKGISYVCYCCTPEQKTPRVNDKGRNGQSMLSSKEFTAPSEMAMGRCRMPNLRVVPKLFVLGRDIGV